jgi:molybdenum cofactor biosynthesis enzyme MoaA
LSSGIRKNRDKLPPLPMIYDDSFREQLHEFIPHLTELRFNGGEPFAQKIVLDICDDVARINPSLKINVATNGTVINKRVRHIMENNNLHINISIDSLIASRYEEIRINGNFDKLMMNTTKFYQYCKDNNSELSIMVNPMRNNWEEMVHFVEFTHGLNANLWFNTILYPKQYAIWNLPTSELKEIYNTMKDQLTKLDKSLKTYSVFEHLVEKQIKNWLLDSYII